MPTTPEVKDRLVEAGLRLFRAKPEPVDFTGIDEANRLLNDLDGSPHAFVLACVMDRQMKAERAWSIPYRIQQKFGSFDFAKLKLLPLKKIQRFMSYPEPLHRFPDEMGRNFYEALQRIEQHFGGDAARIWKDKPSSAEVVYRFLEFRGVGPKIATMAANILARHFKVPFADYYAIDISADVHVRRVFARLRLTSPDAKLDALVYRARSLHPEFPGLMDFPTWEIGRKWCKPSVPLCSECYMNDICPTAPEAS